MDCGLEHEPCVKTRSEAKLLKAFGHSEEAIAKHLDLSVPTLKKYYAEELKAAKHFLELKAGSVAVENLSDDDAKVRQKAAEFILGRKCKWSDKSLSDEIKDNVLDAIVNDAAARVLKKKEEEADY